MKTMSMKLQTQGTLRTVLDLDETLTKDEKKHIKRALGDTGGKQNRALITTKEACEILGICRLTLSRYVDHGMLAPIRYTKRKIRWDRDEIEFFKNNGSLT
jgi:predicted DNA-binding transcriptional regulator AlpA